MDSYDRNYNAAISGLDEAPGTRLGTATILRDEASEPSLAVGFYAVACEWNGKKVISYRGT